MTPILSHLTALILGFLVATLIMWTIHRKQQQDWQKEYRRMMGGIDGAIISLTKPTEIGYRLRAIKILQNTYNGE